MAAATTVALSRKSQDIFIAYYHAMHELQRSFQTNLRARMLNVDKAYQREVDETEAHKRAQAANAAGNTSKLQNITVPVVMPQVETSVTYQTSVFLTGYPLFGVVAAPEYMDAALQLETTIEENSTTGAWPRELMMFFRDGAKYNFAPLEVSWTNKVTASVETDILKNKDEGIAKKIIWSGNVAKRWDPYNTMLDPRVAPTSMHSDGEFIGHTEYMPRMQLKTMISQLPSTIMGSAKRAFESGVSGSARSSADSKDYYSPDVNPIVEDSELTGYGTNWNAWAGLSEQGNSPNTIDYKDTYQVTTLYCRILPSEFDLKLPNSNTPQVFKLIIVNHRHIIYAERQTNAHAMLPVLIGQPNEDGLRYQTKSLADGVKPFQEVASTLMNFILASRRRAITDRVLYDPSRITKAAINSANPSAKIPVRPAAYGKNIGDAVYAFPYREDQAGQDMQQISALLGLSNQVSGQNQASQGQFVKGNRTLQEFDTVMQNANGREQTASILLEHQVFSPMKHIIKLNTLQYQGGTTLYNQDKEIAVEIDPVQLRRAVLNFKVSDGLIPSSKLINGESLAVALQALGNSPQIAQGYNMAPMFSYLMKTRGANLAAFEKSAEQIAYEQALGSWAQLSAKAIENGIDPDKLPPQPKPEEFGYSPAGNKPTPEDSTQNTSPVTGAQ